MHSLSRLPGRRTAYIKRQGQSLNVVVNLSDEIMNLEQGEGTGETLG